MDAVRFAVYYQKRMWGVDLISEQPRARGRDITCCSARRACARHFTRTRSPGINNHELGHELSLMDALSLPTLPGPSELLLNESWISPEINPTALFPPTYSDDLDALRLLHEESIATQRKEGRVIQHRAWTVTEVFRSDPEDLQGIARIIDTCHQHTKHKSRHPSKGSKLQSPPFSSNDLRISARHARLHILSCRIST